MKSKKNISEPASFVQQGSAGSLLSRRDILNSVGGGLAGMALNWLMQQENSASAASPHLRAAAPADLKPRLPHFAPKATSVIFLFMQGGPSQMDLFDPKPALEKYDGKKPPTDFEEFGSNNNGLLLRSPFKFSKHGQSGMEISELLPHFSKRVDDIALVRSLHTHHNNHIPAQLMLNTGRIFGGRPSIGSWVTYALGSENQDLPAYIALPDVSSLPVDGPRNWTCGWLPPIFQGVQVATKGAPIHDLNRHQSISSQTQRANLDLLAMLNKKHLRSHQGLPELEARIANYELAARMQLAASDIVDVSQETQATRKLYGVDRPGPTGNYGLRCLLARRLVESGVRFVHVLTERQAWDQHKDLRKKLTQACTQVDHPISGLLADLKQRGMLDTTLVVCAGEFGRLPTAQNRDGRDHNRHAFSIWMAGGGIKGGVTYGSTDEFGYAAVENRVSVADFQATILHLMGLHDKKLTYHHDSRDQLLTDVYPARVVKEILA